MIIYMKDIRNAKMCAKGSRAFFNNHNLDFQDFLKNGIDSKLLLATNDTMALQVIEVAENGWKQQADDRL